MTFYIGAYDSGGNNARIVVADSEGNIIGRGDRKTKGIPGRDIPDLVAGGFEEALQQARKEHDVSRLEAIAGSQAGICDSVNGIVLNSPNIEEGTNIEMYRVGEKMGAPFILHNDGNAAALGVLKLDPLARNEDGSLMENIIYVIMGSGLGGGIVINGEIYTGFNGFAGEIGHTTLDADGPFCGCGRRGCWEQYSAGEGIARSAAGYLERSEEGSLLRAYEKVRSEHVFEAARKGDKLAQRILDESARYNIIAVANLVYTFDPQAIFFGEALLKNEEQVLEPIRKGLPAQLMTDNVPLIAKTSVDEPGLYGAVYAAIDHHKKAA
jgi:glucokinase